VAASNPRIQSVLNFFVSAILIRCCRHQTNELCHTFETLITYH
jgi:hypothetical protein